MHSETQRRLHTRDHHWLPVIALFTIAAAGECFLLFVFILGGVRNTSEVPVQVLKWVLLAIHLLPLIASRKVIKGFVTESESGSDAAGLGLATWHLFTTYIALGAMEIGLVLIFGHH